MARGGFIAADVAVGKLQRDLASRDEAKSAIIDALIGGAIAARGRPQVDADTECVGGMDKSSEVATLVDRSDLTPSPLGEVQDIPSGFWKGTTRAQSRAWDWDSGTFFNDNSRSVTPLFEEVVLREKDINLLIKKHRVLAQPLQADSPPKRERKRASTWDDWVAAVAALAFEQQIDGAMTQRDLLDRINARLASWGLHPKEEPTVAPTARAILARWRTSPPTLPLLPGDGGGKP